MSPCAAITKKEFGKDDNNGKDSMRWRNRTIDWYNAERRFIFAAPTKARTAKWIDQITKVKRQSLVEENSQRNKMLSLSST